MAHERKAGESASSKARIPRPHFQEGRPRGRRLGAADRRDDVVARRARRRSQVDSPRRGGCERGRSRRSRARAREGGGGRSVPARGKDVRHGNRASGCDARDPCRPANHERIEASACALQHARRPARASVAAPTAPKVGGGMPALPRPGQKGPIPSRVQAPAPMSKRGGRRSSPSFTDEMTHRKPMFAHRRAAVRA